MNAFHVGQLALAAVVLGLVVERARLLLFRAPLDTGPWLRALMAALAEGDAPYGRAIAVAGRPSWVAEVAHAILGPPTEVELDEILAEFRYEAERRLLALRVLASIATATGFLGAIAELIWLLHGEHGLMGLMAGRPEQVAADGALLAMTIGVAISAFALTALVILRKAAAALIADVHRTAVRLEEVGLGSADSPAPPVVPSGPA